jgi:hypothetical protein
MCPRKIYSKDPIKKATSPFADIVSGCTGTGYIHLKSGVIYKMDVTIVCVLSSQLISACLFIKTISCQKSCDASLFPNYHGQDLCVDVNGQCTGCGQHTSHPCINRVDYVDC